MQLRGAVLSSAFNLENILEALVEEFLFPTPTSGEDALGETRCGHQTRDRYPKASDISSPPCLLRVLPAGAVAGWALHPLEKRRLVTAHVDCGPSPGPARATRLRRFQTLDPKRPFRCATGICLLS
jgi:hypothetical protein